MTITAYILAADPEWIEKSVLSYYNSVKVIIVSYDQDSISWTGAPIDVQSCLNKLRAIDCDGKMRYEPGSYGRPDYFSRPMESETYQRQCALEQAAPGADWVLQLDTDEVLPQPEALIGVLKKAECDGIASVEWPMRVLFRRLRNERYLEVCAADGLDRFEYPGPIAIRPGQRFAEARRTTGVFLRPVVYGDDRSLQLRNPMVEGEIRLECVNPEDAIVHNSWGRDPASIRAKIASWGHNQGVKSWLFYFFRWLPAPLYWRFMRNFHPLFPALWPALKPSTHVTNDNA